MWKSLWMKAADQKTHIPEKNKQTRGWGANIDIGPICAHGRAGGRADNHKSMRESQHVRAITKPARMGQRKCLQQRTAEPRNHTQTSPKWAWERMASNVGNSWQFRPQTSTATSKFLSRKTLHCSICENGKQLTLFLRPHSYYRCLHPGTSSAHTNSTARTRNRHAWGAGSLCTWTSKAHELNCGCRFYLDSSPQYLRQSLYNPRVSASTMSSLPSTLDVGQPCVHGSLAVTFRKALQWRTWAVDRTLAPPLATITTLIKLHKPFCGSISSSGKCE